MFLSYNGEVHQVAQTLGRQNNAASMCKHVLWNPPNVKTSATKNCPIKINNITAKMIVHGLLNPLHTKMDQRINKSPDTSETWGQRPVYRTILVRHFWCYPLTTRVGILHNLTTVTKQYRLWMKNKEMRLTSISDFKQLRYIPVWFRSTAWPMCTLSPHLNFNRSETVVAQTDTLLLYISNNSQMVTLSTFN